ncbi:uncharacterized protein LOC144617590 isoform X2 [Crassostrea virginica]
MGSVWKLRVWVVAFLCIFPLFGLTLPTNPDEGFKFNCGQFLCSFPYQYCDTEGGDYRCLYCRDDFCHSKDQLPDQCRSYCTEKYHLSSTLGPGDLRNVTDIGEATMSDNVEIALWLIVGILLLLLVIIIIVVIFYCRSKANGQNRGGFISNPTDEENPPNVCSNDYEQKSLIDHENSSDSGNSSQKSYTALASLPTQNNFNSLSLSPPQAEATQLEALSVTGPKEIGDSMMPSDISTSLVTQPQESGESRHHEGYYETNLLKNSFPDRSGDREESSSDVTAAHEKAVMSCGAYKNLTAKDTFESTHVKSEPCC